MSKNNEYRFAKMYKIDIDFLNEVHLTAGIQKIFLNTK